MRVNQKCVQILAAVGISAGLFGAYYAVQLQISIVQAAKQKRIIVLKKNAYVYNQKGKRVNSSKIKKGSSLYTSGTKKIKGKLYYKVDGGYINAKNVASKKAKKSAKTAQTASKSITKQTASSSTIEVARQRFLSDVNNWNAKKGRGKFTSSAAIQKGSQARAEENAALFAKNGEISHVRSDGSLAFSESAFNAKGVDVGTEVIGVATISGTGSAAVQSAVDTIFDQFINHDEASNWTHKKALTKGLLNKYSQMGIGVAQAKYDGNDWLIIVANTGKAK